MLRHLDVLGSFSAHAQRDFVSLTTSQETVLCHSVHQGEDSVFRGQKNFLTTIKDVYLIFMIKTILPTLGS